MPPTPIGQAPQMIRTGNGRMVPVSKPFGLKQSTVKKFLIVFPHYDGDVVFAEELASLVADLERTRNHEADILLVRRFDSRQMSNTVITKLQSKFDKVLTHQCRRFAKGHPFGCNEMWYDLVMMMGQSAPYRDDYYAFIPLESDAVPTRPGWIGELIHEWKSANEAGRAAVGYIHDDPRRHLNGVAVYAADIYHRVGSGILKGGNPQVAYDIRHSGSILPIAQASPLFHFRYRTPTTTPEQVFAETNGVMPAIFHGVKDRSAMKAVRDRHINMKAPAPVAVPMQAPLGEVHYGLPAVVGSGTFPEEAIIPIPAPEPETKRLNAYTYYHKLTGTTIETQAILDLWRKGWATRGWNPVILTFADAVKNPKFPDFEAAISKLPCATGDRKRWAHQFYRWLALESKGGGLMVDYDVLPGDFTPSAISDNGVRVFRDHEASEMYGAYQNKDAIETWIKHILTYDAQPLDVLDDKPHVTDDDIMRAMHQPESAPSNMTHFTGVVRGTDRKSVAMEKFLSGK